MTLIDGKAVSEKLRGELKADVAAFIEKTGIKPGLAVVLVGDDPASKVYVRNKRRGCRECGMYSEVIELPADTTQAALLQLILDLNTRTDIHGILVQEPTPRQIDNTAVINAIDPRKDVDAFHPMNVGRIMTGNFDFLPCTPAGVMELLDAYNIPIAGKECVVVGRSNIVGKPQAMLLLHRHGTVTICHSKTVGLAEVTRRADILVAAVGKPGLITGDMVKEGAAVIDVGMNRIIGNDGREHLTGDVDFESVSQKAAYLTPVPGGVGPMTITMLLRNTLTAAKKSL
ncbi:MAG: bifunctional methylenetetrahydrofolate dehydrogenase/methenyltetrahydrofolate cyclohydrolase FolD [Clostridiales bacterium]|nr:bifunctional methylenetetrahydrofolate dehydrogenase/methenyltetrahydrofolate cyclohydrolase FolD [Clostridiales bacterium]